MVGFALSGLIVTLRLRCSKLCHRSFVAFEIFALAAADITRFFPPVVLPLLPIPPKQYRQEKFCRI